MREDAVEPKINELAGLYPKLSRECNHPIHFSANEASRHLYVDIHQRCSVFGQNVADMTEIFCVAPHPDPAKGKPRVHQDRDQDTREDGEEDERVHVPGAAEKKRESGKRLYFQKRERDPEKEHVPVDPRERRPRSNPPDCSERDRSDHEQAFDVDRRE